METWSRPNSEGNWTAWSAVSTWDSPWDQIFPGGVFRHDSLLEIWISGGAVAGQTVLRLHRRALSTNFTSTRDHELSGGLFEFSHAPSTAWPHSPSLRFAMGAKTSARIGIFSDSALDWLPLPDSLHGEDTTTGGRPALATPLRKWVGNLHGLLVDPLPLSATGLEIIPNPFSPMVLAAADGNDQYGARILFQPHSAQSDRVNISLKIYNQRGELVRVLEANRSVPKVPLTYWWDGKTDSGHWARNGRYVVMLLVKEATRTEIRKYLKPVVVFK